MSDQTSGLLAGKIALVTGGARGIGWAIVTQFVAEGARVVVLDLLPGPADEALAAADAVRPSLEWVTGDVAAQRDVERAVQACVTRFGRLDILVNNAGINIGGALVDLDEADWDRTIAVNLKGPFLAMKAAAPVMAAGGGGAIVNITSISARSCYPGQGAYSASKAGLENLSRQAAVEFGRWNIRVNAISPGWVRTALTEYIYQRPGELARRSATVPLGRIGTTMDVARLAVFLASDESAYISGESIEQDGGLLAAALRSTFELARLRPVPSVEPHDPS